MAPSSDRAMVRSCTWPLKRRSEEQERCPTENPTPPLFEIRTIPGRGRGLFPLVNLTKGTLILAETPFFTLLNIDIFNPTESSLLQKVSVLTSKQERQFRSLHNNYAGEEPTLVSIARTNVLDITPEIDAIYPTFSLLNHSCVPNAHYSWNKNIQKGTLHAIGDIKAGEEITISYGDHPRGHGDFKCSCTLCTSLPPEMAHSDTQRNRLITLRTQIMHRLTIQHENCLSDLREMKGLLQDIYRNSPGTALAWVYFTASEVAASQSDLARASVFAERAYEARVVCEGVIHQLVLWCGKVGADLRLHEGYGSTDFRETSVDMVPLGLGVEEFEEWLWTWE
ncbi:hypothetical protein VTL71DRAFT_1947 [Oculimacula yallundae]|uniref:SET domain-containing protein n=1 Tax=Oculimacula yallundae TaxID=86028 RepID=A0ABR4CC68_9HELO